MTTEPKYDEDVVNLGYLKKIVADPDGNLENIYENVSKHYASKPQPPYHKGDTWIDGNIIYTCINDREIGTYQDSDWTTESGAREEAEKKNKVFLRQPSNYSVGDMWILQSDEDHKAGKKGEILISTAGRKEYNENDWVNMLGYGTIASINEVANNLNDAIERIGVTEEAIADGLIVTFYQDTIPEGKHIGDLWYVTETVGEFIKGKLYRYNGEEWEILKDPEITQAFEEANEARIVADGKIQSFYTATAPLENVGVGDLWIDTDDNNKLYRYNGTNWVAVYDTRIDTIQKEVETVTETTVEIQTDLGQINNRVNTVETTITTLGQIEKAEGKEITVDASNNPAKLYVYGNTEQATRSGKNKYKLPETITKNGITYIKNNDGTFNISGTATASVDIYTDLLLSESGLEFGKTYTTSVNKETTGVKYYVHSYKNSSWVKTQLYLSSGTIATQTMQEIDTDYIRFNINIPNGTTVDFKNIKLQLEEGTKTDWEPFGVSPSPDYPSEIRNVGDNINLFDKNNYNKIVANFSSGKITYHSSERMLYFKCEKNTTYSFQKLLGTNYIRMTVAETIELPAIDVNYQNTKHMINVGEYFYTTSNTAEYIVFWYYCTGSELTEQEIVDSIKIEKGKAPTSYSEYGCGSIDIKMHNENLCYNPTTTTNNLYMYVDSKSIKQKELFLSFVTNADLKNNSLYLQIDKVDAPDKRIGEITAVAETTASISLTLSDANYEAIKNGKELCFIVYKSRANFTKIENAMIIEGLTAVDYIEHQEQTVVFPLSQGQLLHKGDYLAEDGIHQVRKTLVLDSTETWRQDTISEGYRYVVELTKNLPTKNDNEIVVISNMFRGITYNDRNIDIDETIFSYDGKYICINTKIVTSLAYFKSYLAEQYANGTPVMVEYPLAEEIVIPYTPEQQKVLDSIETFKGINNIYCIDEITPEKMILTYYPNTPFNDTLVNKDTFDKVTTEMNAEFNIRANEVETSVREQTTASILTLLNNGYLNAEQVNALVGGNADDIATVKEQLTQTVTSSQMQIEITKAIEGGVSYLKNTLFTIDDKGMTIATSQDEFNALYSNKGMYLYTYEELMAHFDVDGTTITGNLTLEGDFITPNLRMMNTEVDEEAHVHIHWIGG